MIWRRWKWISTFIRCYKLSMEKQRGAGRPPRVEAIFMARCAAHIASLGPRRKAPKPGWLEGQCYGRSDITAERTE